MTTIFETVKSALDTLGVSYGMGTYLTTGDLPDTYLVYTLIDGIPAQSADDAETERRYRVQVSIYARGGLVSIPNVDTAMLAKGFTKGPERELPYDDATGHYGLAKDYYFLE